MKKENINNIFERKENSNFFLIAGPCVIEDRKITFEIAERLKSITENLNIPFNKTDVLCECDYCNFLK